ncbi:MAG: hypothetical protein U9N84_00790 [Actinomycetota bacterium]|nr:hypothetical protein [Actinomycetota bacterium]
MLTGWFVEDWSSYTTAERKALQSEKLRLEATFDGVAIDLVVWPFEIVNDTAFKIYSFQFPGWLQNSHVLEVDFIDDTENYVWTIRDNLTTNGSGYPQTAVAAAASPLLHSDWSCTPNSGTRLSERL